MILLNGKLVNFTLFPNGESKLNTDGLRVPDVDNNSIAWRYDTDSDIWQLIVLTRHLQDKYPGIGLSLRIAYLPYSRQDRAVGGGAFTLRPLADIINSLGYLAVEVVEPHSDVSTALLYRCRPVSVIPQLLAEVGPFDTVIYPDAGAEKRYQGWRYLENKRTIIGSKRRDAQGRVAAMRLDGPMATGNVVILDDLCSYGGTFKAVLSEMKARGDLPKDIYLVVTHCEKSVLSSPDLLNSLTRLITTDSMGLSSYDHRKLSVIPVMEAIS